MDPGEVGSRNEDIRELLHHGCSGDAVIWVRYLGGEPRMARTLGGFYYRVTRKLLGKLPKRRLYGGWYYPTIADVLRDAELEDI